jgi:hypothetical protein
MAYVYSDESREEETFAMPNVEIFEITEPEEEETGLESGYYYAYGFPGCLWDGEPCGPYATYEEAFDAMREEAN